MTKIAYEVEKLKSELVQLIGQVDQIASLPVGLSKSGETIFINPIEFHGMIRNYDAIQSRLMLLTEALCQALSHSDAQNKILTELMFGQKAQFWAQIGQHYRDLYHRSAPKFLSYSPDWIRFMINNRPAA